LYEKIKGLNMATTVIAAFNEFMKDTVNLEKADTDDARASRDWLIGKINDFENDEVFPVSYPGSTLLSVHSQEEPKFVRLMISI
jgi:hypothetical protein